MNKVLDEAYPSVLDLTCTFEILDEGLDSCGENWVEETKQGLNKLNSVVDDLYSMENIPTEIFKTHEKMESALYDMSESGLYIIDLLDNTYVNNMIVLGDFLPAFDINLGVLKESISELREFQASEE